MARPTRAALAALALFAVAAPAAAQQADSAEIRKLREQIEAITRTLEEMQLGKDVVVEADSSAEGFGPAASKVYRVRQGVSIGGYGEALYQNYGAEREDGAPSGRRDELDYLRAIVYFGYKFNDKLLFNSEVEFEHASTGKDGEVSVEFAYLDYRLSPALGFRGGLLLAPMGFVNELHEPPIFLGTTRPETERQVIPSTWRENGLGAFGSLGDFTYRAYLMAGFDATGFAASGLRGGAAERVAVAGGGLRDRRPARLDRRARPAARRLGVHRELGAGGDAPVRSRGGGGRADDDPRGPRGVPPRRLRVPGARGAEQAG